MSFEIPPLLAKYGGMGLVVAGIGLLAYATLAGDNILKRYYFQYVSYLDRSLRLLFMPTKGEKIARWQLAGVALLFWAFLISESPDVPGGPLLLQVGPFLLLGVLLGPYGYLVHQRSQHIKALEAQVDSFILGLANSLKTVPNPAAALSALAPVLPKPTKLEVDRVLAEIKVGSTIEQGLMNMASRLKSPNMDSALSAVLIGLQVGGNLPTVLENTAATIREMNRLDGVVKTKTAEGRAQLLVLTVFPFFILWAFSSVQEGYFDPLQSSLTGHIVTTIAMLFWVAALLAARKILKVDI